MAKRALLEVEVIDTGEVRSLAISGIEVRVGEEVFVVSGILHRNTPVFTLDPSSWATVSLRVFSLLIGGPEGLKDLKRRIEEVTAKALEEI